MIRTFIFFIVFLFSLYGYAQKATVKGNIGNPDTKIHFSRGTAGIYSYYFTDFPDPVTDAKGDFSIDFMLDQPEIIIMGWNDTVAGKYTYYNLFLTPGDALTLTTKPGQPMDKVSVTGKGAVNNQPLNIAPYVSLDQFDKDTLPDRVYTYLLKQHQQHRQLLKEHIDKYKPSAAFVSAWKNNLRYEMANAYFAFEHNNAFGIRNAYERNKDQWLNKREAIFSVIRLSDDEAMNAPAYADLLRSYLLRTKESLWNQAYLNRELFLKEWYGKDTANAWQRFTEDMENDLKQRIIEKQFTGKAKEFLYALLINDALEQSTILNLVNIYKAFKKEFPQSSYISRFEEQVAKVEKKQQQSLTEKMHFVENGSQLNTWEEVLDLFKGQTVLLDMWGTWCGPCREEIERNSPAIKAHFKGKPLQYLYIANYDQQAENKWKQLIAYFNLEGYHILANDKLTKDIMGKIKGTGYPTYAIIHKDGSYELSEAGYPMKRDVLVQQLEKALE